MPRKTPSGEGGCSRAASVAFALPARGQNTTAGAFFLDQMAAGWCQWADPNPRPVIGFRRLLATQVAEAQRQARVKRRPTACKPAWAGIANHWATHRCTLTPSPRPVTGRRKRCRPKRGMPTTRRAGSIGLWRRRIVPFGSSPLSPDHSGGPVVRCSREALGICAPGWLGGLDDTIRVELGLSGRCQQHAGRARLWLQRCEGIVRYAASRPAEADGAPIHSGEP